MANNKDFKVKNGIQPTAYHEGLGTVTSGSVGYGLTAAFYTGTRADINVSAVCEGITFKPDGTKIFIAEISSDSIYQYPLSTAWDITTLGASSGFSVATEDSQPRGVEFNSNGTKMYVVGTADSDINQYSLSTAWDVTTASFDSVTFSVASQGTQPRAIKFKPDGTKMYIADADTDGVFQYSLSTAYDLSTASYDSVSLDVSSQEATVSGLDISGDGTQLFIVGGVSDSIHKYNLSTAYDLSTATYSNESFSFSSETATPLDIFFFDDGDSLFMLASDDFVYQYSTVLNTNTLDLSTGSVFEITPTSDIQINLSNPASSGTVSQATLLLDQAGAGSYDVESATYANKSFSVATEESGPQAMHFKSDGTQFFLVGNTDTVRSYSLSTAWDISTTSYDSKSISVNAQNSIPLSVHVKSDGTKFYMLGTGTGGDAVYSYSMSTAYDLSTASYDSVSFSVATQTTSPQAMWFKPDGTTMYIASSTVVYQYTLSTAWNISTASYASKSFTTSTQDTNMDGLTFKSDGTKVYMTGVTNDNVYQYSLSTAWDISTASYDSIALDTSSESGDPRSLQLSSDGKVLMVLGTANDTVYQYNASAAATITYPSTLEWPSGTAPTSPAIGDTDVLTFTTSDGGTSYQAVQAIDGAS